MKSIQFFKNIGLLFLFFAVTNNMFAQLSPLTIGSLNAGDSIVVFYDATINAGASAAGFISNQGTVTASSGISIVTDDPKTAAADDPTITFLNVNVLPVRLVSLSAVPKGSVINVSWKVNGEINMIRYEVEKSKDGIAFGKIGEAAAINNGIASDYAFTDVNPINGANYYRLRMIDNGATPKYSIIVRVDIAGKYHQILVYPNPASAAQHVTLRFTNMQKGNYEMLLFNDLGQTVYRKTLNHADGSADMNISLPAGISKGSYRLQFIGDAGMYNQMLIVR